MTSPGLRTLQTHWHSGYLDVWRTNQSTNLLTEVGAGDASASKNYVKHIFHPCLIPNVANKVDWIFAAFVTQSRTGWKRFKTKLRDSLGTIHVLFSSLFVALSGERKSPCTFSQEHCDRFPVKNTTMTHICQCFERFEQLVPVVLQNSSM